MTPPRRHSSADAIRLVVLLTVMGVIWCLAHGYTSVAAWSVPREYGTDSWFFMAAIKACMEGAFPPFSSKLIPNLGAPFVASWNDYPFGEDLLFFFWGCVARVVGLVPAVNLSLLGAAMLAAGSFYWVARQFRWRWELCWVAAMLFGLSPYLMTRGVRHLVVSYYWHIPLCLLVAFWGASRTGIPARSRRLIIALGTAVVTGIQNPYFLNFFLQLLVLASLRQAVRRAGITRVVAPLLVAGVSLGAFLMVHLDSITYRHEHGPNPAAVDRSPTHPEEFSLRPLDLLVPPPWHRNAALSQLGLDEEKRHVINGEFPSPYLGLVAGTAMVALLAHTLLRLLKGRGRPPSGLGLTAVWFMAYAGVGGLHSLLGVVGFNVFRSNNRVSILLGALALFHGVKLLSALPQHPRRVLAAALLVLGLWDQIPGHLEERAHAAQAHAEADEHLVRQLEERLPAGAMVFQMPVMRFPEVASHGGTVDHELFRPYLFSTHLRFSYGNVKGRGTEEWQYQAAQLPVPQLVQRLEDLGFGAIYINRKGAALSAIDTFVGALVAAGKGPVLLAEDGDSQVIFLTPSASPVLPGVESPAGGR